ncbi:MAG: bifunctional diguanylate cyclase/phosphodiesterase, partial [bacterium]
LNKDNFMHTKEYNKNENIQKILEGVGFENLDDLGKDGEKGEKELCIHLSEWNDIFFTYCVFEKNDNIVKLSEDEVLFISILLEVIDLRVKEILDLIKSQQEIATRDSINVLLSQKFAMAIIDDNTNKILYFTELFSKKFPNAKLNQLADEVINEDPECNKLKLDKTICFNLSRNRQAYMIWVDYINEGIKLDNLTEAMLLQSFEDYYINFVKNNNFNYILCSIDIDKFKYINSMFGYSVGDKVLKNISNVLRNFVNSNENFCRIGEDKFCAFLVYNNEAEIHIKLTRLSNLFENMRDEHFPEAKITVVNGVTFVDKELPFNTLLDQATTARKRTKGSHKNKFSYYDSELDLKLQKEIELEEQVPRAVANNEFIVYFQPKFNLNTKHICGAEALVRWQSPSGMIFPDQFIPLFEKNGFIITLDFIVYEKVMIYINKCLSQDLKVYPISVNVSRNHIKDKNFINKFMDLISKYDIPLEYLELEVTESMFVEDRAELKDFINKIKDQNLKVSIDDFGTAYSSLQTLTDVNIDILKIDKVFLDNIINSKDTLSSKDEILIKNIINLAKELDFTGLCEGVETDEQIEFLKSLGCDLGQGYAFAKPMPVDDYHKEYINADKTLN